MRNKRNAAFLAGIGCEQGKANIPATDYAALLQPLGAIFAQQQAPTPPTDDSLGGLSEATAVCVDNAARGRGTDDYGQPVGHPNVPSSSGAFGGAAAQKRHGRK